MNKRSMKEFKDPYWFLAAVNEEGMHAWYLEVNKLGSRMAPYLYFWSESLYEEDIYIILQNYKMDDGSLGHHMHIWVGAGASELDVTHAERYAASVDLWLRRRAPLHWERQNQECEQFHSYFSLVLQYLPGKYKDYRKEYTELYTETERVREIEKSLFSLYVHRNLKKVKQVKCDMSSLNKSDPLILISETDVVYVLGRGSWNSEVLLMIGATVSSRMSVRSYDYRPGVDVVILDKYAATEDWDNFFKALGWEDTAPFPSIPDGTQEEVKNPGAPQLYEILRNRRGHVHYKDIPFPAKKDALDSKSLYILTNGKDDVCLWIGKKNQDRNKAKLYGLAKLREFTSRQLPLSKWPPWQHMTIIPEGLEPLSFKQHFYNWIGQD